MLSRTSRVMLVNTGDPFLGLGLITKAVKGMVGLGRKIAGRVRGSPKLMGAVTTAKGIAQKVSRSTIAKGAAGAVAVGAVAAGTERALSPSAAAAAAAGMVPRGFHVIRKGPHAGSLARNRRMRVTNPKALRRSIRRARGFAKLAKKVLSFTGGKTRGRPLFRKRKRA